MRNLIGSQHVTPAAAIAAITAGVLLIIAHPSHAAGTPAQTCQAGKTDAAGKYSACISKAEKSLALGGDPMKYAAAIAKCQDKLVETYDKAEVTAVAKGGVCPSTDDADQVQDLLDGCTAGVVDGVSGGSLPPDPQACSDDLAECEAQPDAQALSSGQTVCYDTAGSVIACAGTGQDAETQNGAARNFVDNGDGTITDMGTGLMWEKISDDNSIHDKNNGYTWANAFARIATLNGSSFAGHADWRLPNVRELQTLVNFGVASPSGTNPSTYTVFHNGCIPGCSVATCSCTNGTNFWTSSTILYSLSSAWVVDLGVGGTNSSNKVNMATARAVRGGL